jgi:two-component system chemotaxis response regulator CheY
MKHNSVPVHQFPNLPISTVPKRILALDDDADMLCLCALALAGVGYTIDTAADGEQGWEALCATDYDLLLTDNDMPRLTGLELVSRLCSTNRFHSMNWWA